jgi:hypothetical protein
MRTSIDRKAEEIVAKKNAERWSRKVSGSTVATYCEVKSLKKGARYQDIAGRVYEVRKDGSLKRLNKKK